MILALCAAYIVGQECARLITTGAHLMITIPALLVLFVLCSPYLANIKVLGMRGRQAVPPAQEESQGGSA